MNEDLEFIRQKHESFLSELEALAVQAIASGDWSKVRDLINDFKDYHDDSDSIQLESVQRLDTKDAITNDYTAIRDRIRTTLDQLKAEGVTVGKLIEGMRNELTLLHVEDDASADSLTGSSADASQPTETNQSI
jgi:hypothetical protein